ncbi:uncharacterized protein LOC111272047 isoform X2 [Varroa jacobsoni]|uniref:uncharacterized protein LOC111272047 isoform X2 n=1 Tax=Varroa jacobsoni TaxID=62625 RepID=UPI000BF54723|nr:uncharacterized protein LOC111272047 isoform X2 [Varroa jacobsoni]
MLRSLRNRQKQLGYLCSDIVAWLRVASAVGINRRHIPAARRTSRATGSFSSFRLFHKAIFYKCELTDSHPATLIPSIVAEGKFNISTLLQASVAIESGRAVCHEQSNYGQNAELEKTSVHFSNSTF